jgi:hypothetical protein
VTIPEDDYYSVYARWPTGAGNRGGPIRRSHRLLNGVGRSGPGLDGGFWVRIGAYEMEKGERVVRIVGNHEHKGRVVADAIMVIRDVLVGRDGRTASYANPDELAPDDSDGTTAGGPAVSTRHASGNANRHHVVRVARRHMGTPYGHKRCHNGVQEDCSCLTKLVYKHFGRTFPDSPV